MQTLFMHVGLHKTGTTGIQKFLHDNARELENNGVYFPRIGLLSSTDCSYGHHNLAWSLKNDTAENMWGELRREVRNRSAAVVSSEEFEFVRNSNFYDVVKRLFRGWTVVPVCYLRRQDELLQSEYNQYIKDGRGVLDIGAFSKLLAKRLDYRIYIRILEDCFGKGNIKLRIYDKDHLRGDIFSDFLETLGIAGSGPFRRPIGTINPSLNSKGLKIMRSINKRYSENPQTLGNIRRLVVERYKTNVFTKHCVLTEDECQSIMKQYDECNRWLAECYFDQPGEALFSKAPIASPDRATAV